MARRPGPLGQDLGQAPVHHLDLAEVAYHDVGRFQIAMDHAPGVGISDRLADLLEDVEESRQILAPCSPAPPRSAAKVRPSTNFMAK